MGMMGCDMNDCQTSSSMESPRVVPCSCTKSHAQDLAATSMTVGDMDDRNASAHILASEVLTKLQSYTSRGAQESTSSPMMGCNMNDCQASPSMESPRVVPCSCTSRHLQVPASTSMMAGEMDNS